MTTVPVTNRSFREGLVDWIEQTTNPNAGAGTVAAIGSAYLRPGTYPNTPTEVYYKLLTPDTGWVKQNLALNIFNVRNFGATGDGVADDTTAINAAVTAALAIGGGVIYFPPVAPGGAWRLRRPAVAPRGSILLSNVQNLIFIGDGYASKVDLIDDAQSGSWSAFIMRNGTSNIGFYNFQLAADAVTNPDPGQQNHLLQIQGVAGDANGGTSHIDVVGMWWGAGVGDRLRILGDDVSHPVEDVRYSYSGGDYAVCRSITTAQSNTLRINVHYTFSSGSHDQQFDMEPTGTTGPEEWSYIGNHSDHQSQLTVCWSFSGVSDVIPQLRCLVAFNTITHGGNIGTTFGSKLQIRGNIIQEDSTLATAIIDAGSTGLNLEITNNILASEGDINRMAVSSIHTTGPRQQIVNDNVMTIVNSNAGAIINSWQQGDGILCAGNIAVLTSNAANKGTGFEVQNTQNVDLDHLAFIGNMSIGATAANKMAAGFNIHPSSNAQCRNCNVSYNWIQNAVNAILFDRGGVADGFLDWRMVTNNNGLNLTSMILALPNNEGVAIDGNAGPGAQISEGGTTPASNVTAGIGSVGLNTGGASATVLSYKESGTGNTGWVTHGSPLLVWGTQDSGLLTTEFLVPGGEADTAALSTEVKLAIPRAVKFRNMRLQCVAGTGAATITYTLRKNGADTTMTFNTANTATTGSDLGSVITFATADLMSVKQTKSVAPTTGQTHVQVSLEMID